MPDWVAVLPTVNASLNGLATVLLIAGYVAIKQGRRTLHRNLMLTTFGTSVVFLACYLTYHFALHHYTGESGKKFLGQGVIRPIYFTILISHILLAVPVAVLACMTIYRAWRQRWEAHRQLARITYPIWLYVSITGVVIYCMLYHWPVQPVAPAG
jgi:protein SCO1